MSAAPDQLDRVFSALASAPRRTIVERLAVGPTVTPTFTKEFEFSKQALSRHLKVLQSAGLTQSAAKGRLKLVSLDVDALRLVSDWIDLRQEAWSSSLSRLDALLQGKL